MKTNSMLNHEIFVCKIFYIGAKHPYVPIFLVYTFWSVVRFFLPHMQFSMKRARRRARSRRRSWRSRARRRARNRRRSWNRKRRSWGRRERIGEGGVG